jgi:hypothetical protein
MTFDDPIRAMRGTVGVLWPGDPAADIRITPEGCRLHRVFDALRQVGLTVEPVVYADEVAERVRDRLLKLDGVLVWVNPIHEGRDRTRLDALLREVADAGRFVSAHPDVILKMGTKEALVTTQSVGWGDDVHVYRTSDEMRTQLPARLAAGRARVIKQDRGHSGQGIWKVERVGTAGAPERDMRLRVRQAPGGSPEEELSLADFAARCEPYFAGGGRMIDQPYQERLPEGMIRCYLVHDRVEGFGHQAINALHPPPPPGVPASEAPRPGRRLYFPPTRTDFQPLRRKLEDVWLPAMQRLLDIDTPSLPVLWDADFLLGPRDHDGRDTYVLCEINVSSVFPFPEEALVPLARAAWERILASKSQAR